MVVKVDCIMNVKEDFIMIIKGECSMVVKYCIMVVNGTTTWYWVGLHHGC